MTKEYINMKFSDYIRKQGDEFRRAGDGYETLSDTSKACIDYAVQRFVDEYAAKQQAVAFHAFAGNHPLRYSEFNNGRVEYRVYTKEQLYDKFIEQQNKDNGEN